MPNKQNVGIRSVGNPDLGGKRRRDPRRARRGQWGRSGLHLEGGERDANISVQTLWRLARALNMHAADLLDDRPHADG
jgi:hypothetical protein